jgi:hypothetical protein
MQRTLIALMLAAGCASGSDYRTRAADPERLHDAVRDLTGVIVYDILSPPQAARVYAYASVAAYEAVRHGYPAQRSLAGQLHGLTSPPEPQPGAEYSYPLAAIHAFMTVGRAMTFSRGRMDSLRTAYEARLRQTGIPAPVFERSITYGDTVAKHILAWAAADHYLQTRGYPKYTVTSQAGRWRPTPPAYMDGVEPHWADIRPFVLDSSSQFRPKPPHRFDMKPGSPFYRQVFEVYETGKRLTDEQRAIAAFWDCNPYVMHVQGHTMFATKKITPGGHWMGIAGLAARKAGADFMRSAAVYARTAVALADGFLSVWDEKYRSNVIRPESVINTYLDERWEPLLQTPPFPEYTSGHSGISTAAATVLTDEFGDGFAFTDDVEADYGLPPRSFSSFKEASAEAAISRLYGGIHYRMAIEEGIGQGRKVGELVIQRVRTRASTSVASQ